ncbi:MAG TPA: S8 family serine peptidase, partial [Stenomitos sp.]
MTLHTQGETIMNWFGGSTKKRSQQQRSKSHQSRKQVPQQTFILEPLITPSGLVDSIDHTPHPLDVDLHTTELPDVHLPEIDVTHIPDATHPVIEAVEIHPLTEIGSEPHSLTNLPQAPEDYSVETNPDVFELSDYPVETEHSLNESSTEHQLDLETPESQAVETHTDVSSTGDYSVLADHTVEVPIADHELDPLPFLHTTSASVGHSDGTSVAGTTPAQLDSTFTSGVFTVGAKGEVSFDYLFDGGAYEGQVAIFNLNGMEHFVPGSEEFMHEAANRALSNSNLGHIVMSDATEGARFSGSLPWEGGFNSGEYQGVTTFSMNPGDKFGIMLVPNGTVQQVWDGENCGDVHPLFSMTTANPNEAFHVGQIADVNGHGNTFVMEDLRMDGHSDKDYNDIIFQVRGATGQAVHLDDVINPDLDWRMTELGEKLMEYIKPPANQPLVGFIDSGLSAENLDIDPFHVHFGSHSDYVANDGNPLLQPGEGSEHGTHVTGIVAATSGNSIGIDGINDQAPIYVARATGSGQWAQALTDFVDAAKESGQPNAIANLSLDLTQVNPDGSVTTRYEFTPQERGALEYARQNNVLVVVSAGNDGGVMSALGQASQEFDNIITVGAAKPIDLSTPVDNSFNKISVGETPTLDIPDISTDINTTDTDSLPINDYPDSLIPVEQAFDRADYSSYGYGLDLVASGGTIDNPVLSTVRDGVGTMAGTSVATAQVTGAASQVWAANPGLSYRQVIEI